MRKPRAYLAVPLIKNYDAQLARRLAEVIEGAGFELSSWWVVESSDASADPRYVFERDVKAIESSDVLIADVDVAQPRRRDGDNASAR